MVQNELTPATVNLDKIIDDFRAEVIVETDHKKKIRKLLDFVYLYHDTIGNRSIPFLEDSLDLSLKSNYTAGEVLTRLSLVHSLFVNGDFANIPGHWSKVNDLLDTIKNEPREYAEALHFMAFNYWFNGEFDKGFDKIFEALKYVDRIDDPRAEAWIYYAIAVFYFDTKDLQNSQLYYEKALGIFEKMNFGYGIARSKTGVASVKIRQENFREASPLLESAILLYREKYFYSGLARALNDLSLIEKANKNYTKAIELLSESLQIRQEINHVQGLITTLTELGEIYLVIDQNEKAREHLEKGLNYSITANSRYKAIRLHKLLSDCFKKTGNVELALQHFEKFHNLKSEVLGEESVNNIRKLQTKFDTEKSEKEAEIHRLKNVELKKHTMRSNKKIKT